MGGLLGGGGGGGGGGAKGMLPPSQIIGGGDLAPLSPPLLFLRLWRTTLACMSSRFLVIFFFVSTER